VVRDAVVLPRAQIGRDAVVEGSIVGAGADIGAGSHLSELTVVGDDVVVPAGSALVGATVPQQEPA
jgi:NDP-sugar pyrophosphorylase family protein